MQLLQLMQHDFYPEDDAAALADQARARILIYARMRTICRAAAASRAVSLPSLSVTSRIAAIALRLGGAGVRSFARRVLFVLLLLACIALYKFRRGGIVLALQQLLRYKWH